MVIKLFSSKYCIPCEILKKWLEAKNIKFKEINVDTLEGYELARKLNVRGIPTLIVENEYIVGLPSSEKKLEEMIKSAMGMPKLRKD